MQILEDHGQNGKKLKWPGAACALRQLTRCQRSIRSSSPRQYVIAYYGVTPPHSPLGAAGNARETLGVATLPAHLAGTAC